MQERVSNKWWKTALAIAFLVVAAPLLVFAAIQAAAMAVQIVLGVAALAVAVWALSWLFSRG